MRDGEVLLAVTVSVPWYMRVQMRTVMMFLLSIVVFVFVFGPTERVAPVARGGREREGWA